MKAKKVDSEASVSADLVARILNGDSVAEAEMVARYERGLKAMLFNRARDRNLAEDVAQDTWLLVIEKIRQDQLRDHSKVAAFIVQIAKNQLIMQQRARQRRNFVSEDEASEVADKGPSPEAALGHTQLGRSVSMLLAELTVERDRQILKRFYLVGEEKEELCKEFGLTPAHFDRVLYRARERFKVLWEQNPDKKYL